jgi:hypothetical protein
VGCGTGLVVMVGGAGAAGAAGGVVLGVWAALEHGPRGLGCGAASGIRLVRGDDLRLNRRLCIYGISSPAMSGPSKSSRSGLGCG